MLSLFLKTVILKIRSLLCDPKLTLSSCSRRDVDRDAGLRPVLGLGQRGDGRPHPLQRAGLRRRPQAGPEGEAGLNVCVWKAARPRGPRRLLLLRLFVTLPPASAPAGLEPLLTEGGGGGEAGAGAWAWPVSARGRLLSTRQRLSRGRDCLSALDQNLRVRSFSGCDSVSMVSEECGGTDASTSRRRPSAGASGSVQVSFY